MNLRLLLFVAVLSSLSVGLYAQKNTPALPPSSPDYDLLLKGGHVIDAKNDIDEVYDVAIKDGKIAKVAKDIPASYAVKTVVLKDMYVVPGLIDIHTHVYAGTGERNSYAGDDSVYPDGFTLRGGVTTIVDAGSSGWRNFEDFKDRIIDRSQTRVLAMLNIVGHGMRGAKFEDDTTDMQAEPSAAMAKKYPNVIVGIKTAHYVGPEWIPVEQAVKAGTIANIPVMVDFGARRVERPLKSSVPVTFIPMRSPVNEVSRTSPRAGRAAVCARGERAASTSTSAMVKPASPGLRRFRCTRLVSHPTQSPPICISIA